MNTLRKIGRRLDATVGVGKEETLFFEMHSDWPLPKAPLPSGVRIQRLESEQAKEFCISTAMNLATIGERWAAGDACFMALSEGRLAHYSWVKSAGLQPVTEADVVIPIRLGEFWIYHCWTEEWARGRRIYPGVLGTILRDYFVDGYTRGHVYTSRTNLASQRGIEHAGFRYTSSKWSLRLGSHWYRLKGCLSIYHD